MERQSNNNHVPDADVSQDLDLEDGDTLNELTNLFKHTDLLSHKHRRSQPGLARPVRLQHTTGGRISKTTTTPSPRHKMDRSSHVDRSSRVHIVFRSDGTQDRIPNPGQIAGSLYLSPQILNHFNQSRVTLHTFDDNTPASPPGEERGYFIYNCKTCVRTFDTKESLHRHQEMAGMCQKKVLDLPVRLLRCPKCDLTFQTPLLLGEHINQHPECKHSTFVLVRNDFTGADPSNPRGYGAHRVLCVQGTPLRSKAQHHAGQCSETSIPSTIGTAGGFTTSAYSECQSVSATGGVTGAAPSVPESWRQPDSELPSHSSEPPATPLSSDTKYTSPYPTTISDPEVWEPHSWKPYGVDPFLEPTPPLISDTKYTSGNPSPISVLYAWTPYGVLAPLPLISDGMETSYTPTTNAGSGDELAAMAHLSISRSPPSAEDTTDAMDCSRALDGRRNE